MKQNIGIVVLVAFCAGCASDSGIHHVILGAENYKCDPVTNDLIPNFRIDEKRPEIEDQGRATILGKWRVVINRDFMVISTCAGNYGSAFSMWEIDVYEFNDDGTYSMWRVAEDKETVLKNSGCEGLWTYSGNILRLQCKRVFSPGLFSFSSPRCYESKDSGEWCEFRAKWHSKSAFTLENADLCKTKMGSEKRTDQIEEVEKSNGRSMHYDENGCLHERSVRSDGRFDMLSRMVTNPKLFKRMDE